MIDTVTVRTPYLYVMRDTMPREDAIAARMAGIEPGRVYWVHGTRRSSLGGCLAQVSTTYRQPAGYSPGKPVCDNLPLRYLKAI